MQCSQYQRLTSLYYVCWHSRIVRALDSGPEGTTDASSNPVRNIELLKRLKQLLNNNSKEHYFIRLNRPRRIKIILFVGNRPTTNKKMLFIGNRPRRIKKICFRRDFQRITMTFIS